ncbi:uncharacterized protein LOC103944992 [Pyrus x bretschneideri]|uniref:uncharacterized protein LOC103944992 n=1 Tax=Pyrus x bretschneideri TaxID=225117 RepID=UPI00202DCC68|nr:uncharacterized protein LOC103944992 [Pyrus x bretschneideri]
MAGEIGGSCGGENDAPSSPKSRIKFLCSHGGRILPRPADGQLKYVGGETRVIALSRGITYAELMEKLSTLSDGDMVLKYQPATEDLDALVSVRNDEDLKHMLDEYDRQESEGSPRPRAFLFPSKPIMIASPTPPLEHQLEQRYIDAINGIIRSPPKMQPPPLQQQQQIAPVAPKVIASSPMGSLGLYSACSSPKSASQSASPEHHAVVADTSTAGHRFTISPPVHRVHSSPSICSAYQGHVQGRHQHPNYHQNHHHHHQAYQSSFSARAHHRGIRTPPPLTSPGRSESGSTRCSLMGPNISPGQGQNHIPSNLSPSSNNSSPRSSLRLSGGGGGRGHESLPRSPR